MAGQSLWLDNITRDLLTGGTLSTYIDELSVSGLTSNPTIYERAIASSDAYDESIMPQLVAGKGADEIFFELAFDDLRQAADAFRPIFVRTQGVDGWVSLEVSPLLAHDAVATVKQALRLYAKADRSNLFIKIPGTPEGLVAIEEAIYAGVPVNVTLLFSASHYMAAADAYLRGIERRIEAGLDPGIASVASVFVGRWDTAVAAREPSGLELRLGVAMAKRCFAAYRRLLDSDRWQRLENEGARPQRLLWASTGMKNPDASDVMYVSALTAPHTVNTVPEATLLAFADHGAVGASLAADGGDAEETVAAFEQSGIDIDALGGRLQHEGAEAFVRSWERLQRCIVEKGVQAPRP
jgi:transaldolase